MDSFQPVEVQSSLTGAWTPGFQVTASERTESGEEMVRLRRQSDGSMLPLPVNARRVRPAWLASP